MKRLFAFLISRSHFFCDAQKAGFAVVAIPSSKQSFGSMQLIANELNFFYQASVQNGLFSHAKKLQKTLDYNQRQSNLKNQMYYKGYAAEKVLLIDDILTTGATMREAIRAVRVAGAKEIRFLAVSAVAEIEKVSD
ncbi:MAG: ComF family protein [Spirochaetia bacterium]